MLQQYIRYFTDKVIEALNVGSVEMVNLRWEQKLLSISFAVSTLSKNLPDPLKIPLLFRNIFNQEDQVSFK